MEDLTEDSRPDLKSPEFREAARLLGSMRSEKKRLAGARNLEKARQHLEEIRKFKKEQKNDQG